jgi:hypothetical protein
MGEKAEPIARIKNNQEPLVNLPAIESPHLNNRNSLSRLSVYVM